MPIILKHALENAPQQGCSPPCSANLRNDRQNTDLRCRYIPPAGTSPGTTSTGPDPITTGVRSLKTGLPGGKILGQSRSSDTGGNGSQTCPVLTRPLRTAARKYLIRRCDSFRRGDVSSPFFGTGDPSPTSRIKSNRTNYFSYCHFI